MKRILFVAEAVTLAQVVRLVELARTLDPSRYEIHFASHRFDPLVFGGMTLLRHAIHSISPKEVERSIAWGTRIYTRRVLAQYVAEDLSLLDEIRPALVVGDLRWSLLVSAPMRGVKHAALINAYWSPFAVRTGFPMPDHPIVRLLGEKIAAEHFPKALPFVMRHFAEPLNALRRREGFAPYPGLLELLVAGDLTLYPDAPGMIQTRDLPPSHHFLGPVLWSADVPVPRWSEQLDGRPCIYLTLGSSGRLDILPRLVRAVARLPVNVMVSTAGRMSLPGMPGNVFVAEFLPGKWAVGRSSVVVCNGGSSTAYQALAAGKPVIGLPWNLDQYLTMSVVRDLGAGDFRRATVRRSDEVAGLVKAALEGAYAAGAARASLALAAIAPAERFPALVDQETRL